MKGNQPYKGYVAKKGKKLKKVIHPSLKGTFDNVDATLEHNTKTNRYDLSANGKLVLSSSHHDCLYRAKSNGIKWNK